MTQHRAFHPIAVATLSLLVMSAAACGHSSPAAPDAVAATNMPAASATVSPASVETPPAATFPLLAGTFTITDGRGTQLSGVYSGQTSTSDAGEVTTLTLKVKSGKGALKNAAGTLEGHGLGAFTGEGAFSLSVSGTIGTGSGKKSVQFSATLTGVSRISCTGGRIIIDQRADGSASTKGGHVDANLHHEVGNAGCS
jgi:hypothetical protein